VSAPDAAAPLEIERAQALILERARPLGVERVALARARGRYLAEPLVAEADMPPFRSSAMDGFALRHEDTPGVVELIGEAAAGAPFNGVVGPGQGVVISTGAVVPQGADAVVPVEWVASQRAEAARREAARGGTRLEVPRAVPRDYSIRAAGSDVRRGSLVLAPGVRLGAVELAAAASLGRCSLLCSRRPTVALLATGSELQAPGRRLGPGQIYDSNGPLLAAALRDAGARVKVLRRAGDTPQAHRAALAEALSHDVVLTTGGVSVGGHDLVRESAAALGVRELFWRVALRPGKPLSFGVYARAGASSDTLVFGIPGNPVSVLVCFELFVRPALRALQGAGRPLPSFTRRPLAAAVSRNAERVEMIRVRETAAGTLEPLTTQQSHQLALAAGADGLARIPRGAGTLPEGTKVDYLPLRDPSSPPASSDQGAGG